MTDAEALDLVVSRTGHTRFRQLCDPAHPDHKPAYLETVARMARRLSGADPGPDPNAPSGVAPAPPVVLVRPTEVAPQEDPVRVDRARRLVLVTCFYKECGTGCRASTCHWKKTKVTLKECHECHPS